MLTIARIAALLLTVLMDSSLSNVGAQSSVEYVPAPIGLVAKECTFDVGNGALVMENGTVLMSNGTIFVLPQCPYPILHTASEGGSIIQLLSHSTIKRIYFR
jgi:hypothetical protein